MITLHEIIESDLSSTSSENVLEKVPFDEVYHTEMKIISQTDEFDALEQEWNALAWESDTQIFQTFEWNRIWWKHFGATKKLHIAAVYTENKLTGIAPLFEDDITLLGRKVYSCLRFIGSYVSQPEGEPLTGSISYSDYLGCIIQPGEEHIFYRLLLEHFKDIRSDFNEIVLDEVSEESTLCDALTPLIEKPDSGLGYSIKQASSSPVIQLDSSWDAFLDSMSKKSRYTARRYFKRSKKGDKRAFKIKKIEHAEELPGVLSELIQLHQQQWNNRGFSGTFSEVRMRNFVTEISTSLYEKNWLQFNMAVPIEEDTKHVAIDALITYKDKVSLMHRGMVENPVYRKQGPGNVLLYAKLEEAIDNGAKVFDLLRGSEEFKLRLATHINQNKKIIIRSDSKPEGLLPIMAKKYLRLLRRLRTEKSHMILMLSDKPIVKGISEYCNFLFRRYQYATTKK